MIFSYQLMVTQGGGENYFEGEDDTKSKLIFSKCIYVHGEGKNDEETRLTEFIEALFYFDLQISRKGRKTERCLISPLQLL